MSGKYDVVVIGWMLSTLVKSLFQKITEKLLRQRSLDLKRLLLRQEKQVEHV